VQQKHPPRRVAYHHPPLTFSAFLPFKSSLFTLGRTGLFADGSAHPTLLALSTDCPPLNQPRWSECRGTLAVNFSYSLFLFPDGPPVTPTETSLLHTLSFAQPLEVGKTRVRRGKLTSHWPARVPSPQFLTQLLDCLTPTCDSHSPQPPRPNL